MSVLLASGRSGARAALAALVCSCGVAGAQDLPPVPEDSSVEPFESVDPHTRGRAEDLAKLGYEGFGPFTLPGGASSLEVEDILGGVPLLWVETAHFKLGSSLKSYRLGLDPQESDLLAAEIALLRKRLRRIKKPRNELDPWLRLHLYAQRLEAHYAQFCAEFELDPGELLAGPAALGSEQPRGSEKFMVLMLEKTSGLARYTNHILDVEQTFSFRYTFPEGGAFFGLAAESFRDGGLLLDVALHAYLLYGMTHNYLDGISEVWGGVPLWFRYGLGQRYARGVDPRWTVFEGLDERRALREGAWEWEPRVRGLVQNEVYPSWEQMLGWSDAADLDRRAHLMAWSRVDWLMGREDAAPREFLRAVGGPLPEGMGALEARQVLERQREGLRAAWGATPSELEAQWVRFVKRTYDRR